MLTLYEVRDLLRVSMVSLYTWVRVGTLPAVKVGREWRVKQSDLDEWLEARRNTVAEASA